MFTFYDLFVKLCTQKGISPSKAAVDMGLSRSTASSWKTGNKPNDTTIQMVSDYFGVSPSYFSQKEPVKLDLRLFSEEKDIETTEQEQTLLFLFRNLDEIGKAKLLVYAHDLTQNKG